MPETPQSGFHPTEEFISFAFSPSPPPDNGPPTAGPSRLANGAPNGLHIGGSGNNSATPSRANSVASGTSKKDRKKQKQNGQSEKKGKKRAREEEETGPRNLKEERRAAERGCPWVHRVDWDSCRDPAEMLNQEITAFYQYVSPTRVEYEVRLMVIEQIIRAIHKIWPEAVVTPFGSWQTQLYLPTGDIDLVVATNQLTEGNKSRLLAELARAMRLAHITDMVAIISKARVPIIKFVTNDGNINVDISLNQTNGISAGRIVNQYLDVLPGARQLVLVVKAFLSQRSMNEVYTGGIGSYAVICLVISFLQVHPKLRRNELDPEENLGTLLIEFFELYGRNFNYDDVGISIRRGGYYYSKRRRGWMRPGQSFLLSIEDPQDQDNDISGGSFGIRQVRATLAGAYDMLQSKLFERAEQITQRRLGRQESDWVPEDMSLLTAIMGITKESIKHREGLTKLHKDGRLHRQLGVPANTTDIHPHLLHYLQTSQTTTDRRPVDYPDVPRASKKSRSHDSPVGAIMVDDDEVDELDSSDSDNDNNDDDYEDGEIVEAFPNGRGGVGRLAANRFASVSEDEKEHFNDGTLRDPPATDRKAKSPVESRYAIKKTKPNHQSRQLGSKVESDSDDSVIALDTLPRNETKQTLAQNRVKRQEREAFWKAKAQKQVLEISDSDE